MQEIIEFFSGLLNTDAWPPRWYCGKWTDFHGWLYIISNISIWAAYFVIPLCIYYFVLKRKDEIPFLKVFWLFILFILSCGLTHLIDAVIFWYPMYRLSALVLCITALVSWITIFALLKILPKALSLKSPAYLESIVIERTRQLEQANNNLVRINKDMDNFIYSASHDLKSPINNIEGLLLLLKDEIKPENKAAHDLIHRIEGSSYKVKKTIENLTDIVKIQNTPYDDVEHVHVKGLIEEILTENAILVSNIKPEFIFQLNRETVVYSRKALKSILYNLLTNALKYSSPERKSIIQISTRLTEQNKVQISVQDNGLGMNLEQHRDKLFHLFKRFHDHIEGSGVGLYIIHRMIEDRGGKIGVESETDKGTIFTITL